MGSFHKFKQIRGANGSVVTTLERKAPQLINDQTCEPEEEDLIWLLKTVVELLATRLKELDKCDDKLIEVAEDEELSTKFL